MLLLALPLAVASSFSHSVVPRGLSVAASPAAGVSPDARPAVARASRPVQASLAEIGSSYIGALHDHYYLTTTVQAYTLVSVGDVLAQRIEGVRQVEQWDWRRTVRMGVLGLFIAGFGTATWLRHLELWLPARDPSSAYSWFSSVPAGMYMPILRLAQWTDVDAAVASDASLVTLKALLDALIWAPIANTLYLILTPLSEGVPLADVERTLNEKFWPVMRTEVSTFTPYNLVSFSLVPPLCRPFTTGFISMCFAVYISWITHQRGEGGAEGAAEGGEGEVPSVQHDALLRDQPVLRARLAGPGGVEHEVLHTRQRMGLNNLRKLDLTGPAEARGRAAEAELLAEREHLGEQGHSHGRVAA